MEPVATTKLFDHGYVKLIDVWGSDERIIESARMSTDGGFVSWDPYEGHPKGDQGLLSHLYKNNHATPFEMAGATFEVKAPIMVFREWHRHRTQGYNEQSARYAPLPDDDYLPTIERLMVNSGGSNKQAGRAKGAIELTEFNAQQWQKALTAYYEQGQQLYERGLAAGVPKELARLSLTVGRYSKMRATANLRNWIGFLRLRQSSMAQLEIRTYADTLHAMLGDAFPRTMALYDETKPS